MKNGATIVALSRTETLAHFVNMAEEAITHNNYITDDIFTGVIYGFKDLIFDNKFGSNSELGLLDEFIFDFEVLLKKKLYKNKPNLSDTINYSIGEFIKELKENTKAFVRKAKLETKKHEFAFKKLKSIKIKGADDTKNIAKMGKAFYESLHIRLENKWRPIRWFKYKRRINWQNLSDIVSLEEYIPQLINDLESYGCLYKDSSISESIKQKIRDDVEKTLRHELDKRKDQCLEYLHEEQDKQRVKLSAYQDKINKQINKLSKEFISECKELEVYAYRDVVKFLVEKLDIVGHTSYRDRQDYAPKVLELFQRNPELFPDFSNIEINQLLNDIKIYDRALVMEQSEQYGKPFREMFFKRRWSRKANKETFVFKSAEQLSDYLLRKVDAFIFNDKTMLTVYVGEYIDDLIEQGRIDFPIEHILQKYKQSATQLVLDRIDSVRESEVDNAIKSILREAPEDVSLSSYQIMEQVLKKLKDHGMFKGKLHGPKNTAMIIDKTWGVVQKDAPIEHDIVERQYKQLLINIYDSDVKLLQEKIKNRNRGGLAGSVGSTILGIANLVFLGLAIASIELPPVALLASGLAIGTSGLGLYLSYKTDALTKQKAFAQNMINEALNNGKSQDYSEIFNNVPVIGELAVSLTQNTFLKQEGNNEYNIYNEFMQHIENLDPYSVKQLIKELNIGDLDITSRKGKKDFFLAVIRRIEASIDAQLDYVEASAASNSAWSFGASLTTFTLGTILTAVGLPLNPDIVKGIGDVINTDASSLAIGSLGGVITASGGVSLANAYYLNKKKTYLTIPLNRLKTNLGILSNYIDDHNPHIEHNAYIKMPDNICKGFDLDPQQVNAELDDGTNMSSSKQQDNLGVNLAKHEHLFTQSSLNDLISKIRSSEVGSWSQKVELSSMNSQGASLYV